MSKKNLLSTSVPVVYLAISLSMLGFAPGVRAQTYNMGISFDSSSTIPVSQTSYGLLTGYNSADNPTIGLSLAGTGTYNIAPDGGGGYLINSSIQATATMSLPSAYTPTPTSFNLTAPNASGLNLTTPEIDLGAFGGAPFYGLFPPLPSDESGAPYSDTVMSTLQHFYTYGPTAQVQYVTFNGEADLYLGDTITESYAADPSDPGDDLYTFTYGGSTLDLTANIGLAGDPTLTFTGNVVITADAPPPPVSTPDSAPGVVGILTLAGVCIAARWQRKAQAA